MSTRIAVIGAGSLGSYLAAHLAQTGHDVFLCVRRPRGPIRVAGLTPVELPEYLGNPPAADVIILTVKAYSNPSALPWLHQLCRDSQPVAVVQNGVHHAQRVAPFPCVPVLSYVYVEPQDGILHGFEPAAAHLLCPTGPDASRFAALFANSSLRVHQEPAFLQASWRKMLHNCVSNPLTALAGRGLEILREPPYDAHAAAILNEGLAIANAEGAALTRAEARAILDILASYPPGTRTSMLQDREAAKPLELDILNGALVSLGRRHSIPTPVNHSIVRRLESLIMNVRPGPDVHGNGDPHHHL